MTIPTIFTLSRMVFPLVSGRIVKPMEPIPKRLALSRFAYRSPLHSNFLDLASSFQATCIRHTARSEIKVFEHFLSSNSAELTMPAHKSCGLIDQYCCPLFMRGKWKGATGSNPNTPRLAVTTNLPNNAKASVGPSFHWSQPCSSLPLIGLDI